MQNHRISRILTKGGENRLIFYDCRLCRKTHRGKSWYIMRDFDRKYHSEWYFNQTAIFCQHEPKTRRVTLAYPESRKFTMELCDECYKVVITEYSVLGDESL